MIPCDMALLTAELRQDEGYRNRRYRCSEGKWTIGIGHNLEGKKFRPHTWALIKLEHPRIENALLDDHVVLSDGLIERIFAEDVEDACADLDAIWIGWRGLDEERKRALINMSFQMGGQRLATFRFMWAALRLRDFGTAAAEAKNSLWFDQTQESRTSRVIRQLAGGE